MERYNLKVRCPYDISIYQNYSSETIYINNFKPIKASEIRTKITTENLTSSVRINPSQFYSHIPTNDEGEIFISYDLQAVVGKINSVIKDRMESISFRSMAAFIGDYPKNFQEIDVELSRVINLLQIHEFINQDEVQIQGYFLCDIGYFKSCRLFSRETLLSKHAKHLIISDFVSHVESRFPSDIVKRINADVITASVANLEELIIHPQDEWFAVSTDFHRKLLHIRHQNPLFVFGEQYLFRVIVNDLVSPIIEIHRKSEKIKYFIAKESEFKEFLKLSTSNLFNDIS